MYYGFVWNNPCIGKTEFAKNLTMFSCEATKRIDYLVMYGKIPADVVKKHVELYGNHLYYLNGLSVSGNLNKI
jgi:alpha-D-xyloside xylohydrolase